MEVSESQNFCKECGTETVVNGTTSSLDSIKKNEKITGDGTAANQIGFKTSVRIVGQYYSEHQLRLIIHLIISTVTVGVWLFWFLGVMYYVYTGASEDSRIGGYMIENQYGEYVGENENMGVIEETTNWDEEGKKIHPDESPSVPDSIMAVAASYPKYYKEHPFVAVFHFCMIILTGGVFLIYYPARVAYIWFGTPLGARTQEYLEKNGYRLVSEESL